MRPCFSRVPSLSPDQWPIALLFCIGARRMPKSAVAKSRRRPVESSSTAADRERRGTARSLFAIVAPPLDLAAPVGCCFLSPRCEPDYDPIRSPKEKSRREKASARRRMRSIEGRKKTSARRLARRPPPCLSPSPLSFLFLLFLPKNNNNNNNNRSSSPPGSTSSRRGRTRSSPLTTRTGTTPGRRRSPARSTCAR